MLLMLAAKESLLPPARAHLLQQPKVPVPLSSTAMCWDQPDTDLQMSCDPVDSRKK